MDLLVPDTGLLFWMVLIFVLVFTLLAKFGFPVITKSVRKRCDHIEESLEEARKAEVRLSKLAEEQKALLEQTRAEQSRLIRQAGETRDRIIAEARVQADEQASGIIERARQEIALEKEAAMHDIRQQLATLSLEMAQKVIRRELKSDEDHKELIDKIIDEQ